MKIVEKKAFERLFLKESREHRTFTRKQIFQLLKDHGIKLKIKAKNGKA